MKAASGLALLFVPLASCDAPRNEAQPVPAAKPLAVVVAPSATQPELATDTGMLEQLSHSLPTVEEFRQQVEQQISEQNLEEELTKLEQELNGEADP